LNVISQPPNHFKLIVVSSDVQQGFLLLAVKGRLREEAADVATFVISDCQLARLVSAAAPASSPFVVGIEMRKSRPSVYFPS
jgi:hypothetical protein